MIIDLPPQVEINLNAKAELAGVSIEHYIADHLTALAQTPSVADLVKGKQLDSFVGDPVAIQRALRDE